MYKIIGADGKEYGPISADVLRQWIAEGRANEKTQILLDGTSDWKPLSSFPEFAAGLGRSAPGLAAGAAYGVAAAGSASALERVSGPATGLMVVAIIGFVVQALGLVMNLLGTSIATMGAMKNVPQEAWVNAMSGTAGIIGGIIGIIVSAVILVGALKMKKLENYGLAMAASILAIIPCISPCCVIGLPVGIWAAITITKPEIKSAFH